MKRNQTGCRQPAQNRWKNNRAGELFTSQQLSTTDRIAATFGPLVQYKTDFILGRKTGAALAISTRSTPAPQDPAQR
jgi:hypothetical protein